MPLTFIDIEKQKNWRIGLLFILLLLMYFLASAALFQGFMLVFPIFFIKNGSFWITGHPTFLLTLIAFSLVTASIHFYFSAFGAVRSVMNSLNASPPDPDDGIHKRLRDIIDEIHIVTGDKRKIDCMVIPSLSMNALAVADLKGEAVIAITEGLLSRLTRPQLEAVLAHEAYHILSGDCLEATVVTSLFGMYSSMLDKLQNLAEEDTAGFHPAFIPFWIFLKLSNLLNLFISREREYRADAGAIRMTRNPLAMAESLYLISKNWRGSGFIGRGIEMLCIVNPQVNSLDESEGWLADMMSTHPPLRKRIGILLDMAHASMSWLETRANLKTGVSDVSEGLSQREGTLSEFMCPYCRQPLYAISYEKTKVYQCNSCRGVMVDNDRIPRIIVRREIPCPERIKALAKAVIMDNQRNLTIRKLRGAGTGIKSGVLCLKCNNPMFRTFYSLAYLVEIDRCGICGITWFDKDELEMLQCLIENRITADKNLS